MAGREGWDQVLHGRQIFLRVVAGRDAPEHGEGRESLPGRTQGIKVRLFPDSRVKGSIIPRRIGISILFPYRIGYYVIYHF
jgi:hypothetical protein